MQWKDYDTVESFILREMPLNAEPHEVIKFAYDIGKKVGKMELPWSVYPGCTITTWSVLSASIKRYYKIEPRIFSPLTKENDHDSSKRIGSCYPTHRLSDYWRDAGLLFLTILMPITAFVGRCIAGTLNRLRSTRLGKS